MAKDKKNKVEEVKEEVTELENLNVSPEENQEIKLDEAPEEEIEVIDMNNKEVSLLAKGDVTAPRGFVPTINKTKIGEYGCFNGRTFQIVEKDVAVWCDNGKQFSLSSIE